MPFDSLLNRIGFSVKAQGDPPASGLVTRKMPESSAPSQAASQPDFSSYIPLSGRVDGAALLPNTESFHTWVNEGADRG